MPAPGSPPIWLAGRWLQESRDLEHQRVEVIYTTSEGGSILGLTKVSGGGATHFFELEKIAVRALKFAPKDPMIFDTIGGMDKVTPLADAGRGARRSR